MTGPSAPNWDTIGRYLAGESSPDEAATIRRWLQEHPQDATLLTALDAAAKQSVSTRALDVEEALRRVKARAKSGVKRTAVRVAAFAAVAAALLIAAVLVPRVRDESVLTAPLVFSTTIGQRDSLRLPDGSRVVLGPASWMQFRQDNERRVELRGQALFKVAHDAKRPFSVHVEDVVIRDIGTEFSVHHDDPNEPVRVVVHEGMVELTRMADAVALRAGDVGLAPRRGRVEASRGTATAEDLAWTHGRLVFRNAPIGELVADLRRWYGVELRVSDSALLRRHFTGSFEDESVNEVLDAISLALGARVEQRADTVFLYAAPKK